MPLIADGETTVAIDAPQIAAVSLEGRVFDGRGRPCGEMIGEALCDAALSSGSAPEMANSAFRIVDDIDAALFGCIDPLP